jgi:hypothetical protein
MKALSLPFVLEEEEAKLEEGLEESKVEIFEQAILTIFFFFLIKKKKSQELIFISIS